MLMTVSLGYFTDKLQIILKIFLKTLIRGVIIFSFFRQIRLFHKMSFVIMGVLIIFAMSQSGCSLVAGILQMRRYLQSLIFRDVLHCVLDGHIRGVGFWSTGDINRGLRERNACFGHS